MADELRPQDYTIAEIDKKGMISVLLWGSEDVPTEDKWVVYNPIKAALAKDRYIPGLRTIVESSPYMKKNASRAIMLDLVEPIFFVIPFIDRVEDGTYVLKALVKLKPADIQDFGVVICKNEGEWNNAKLAYDPEWMDFTYAIETEKRTTDPAVELLYYPKEVIDVIENY